MLLKTKQPYETLDFDLDCSRRLSGEDEVSSVSASIAGPDSTMSIVRTSFTGSVAKLWVTGGTNDATYKITAHIVSLTGRIIETEFLIHVKDL